LPLAATANGALGLATDSDEDDEDATAPDREDGAEATMARAAAATMGETGGRFPAAVAEGLATAMDIFFVMAGLATTGLATGLATAMDGAGATLLGSRTCLCLEQLEQWAPNC